MRHLGRFFAVLIGLVFVTAIPCAIWTTGVQQMLFDEDTYRDALRSQNVYAELIPALLPAIEELRDEPEFNAEEALTVLNIVENLDDEDWRQIAADLIPPAWLQEQVEFNLTAFFDWISSRVDAPELRIETGFLRERLSGAPGQRAVNRILDSWEPCTEEQVAAFLAPDNLQQDFPFCQPPAEYLAITSAALSETLREQAANIPDVYPPPNWLEDSEVRENLTGLRYFIRVIEATVIELWLFPLALLALIVFLAVRSLKGFGRWTGVLMTISGVFALLPIPLLLSPFLVPQALTDAVTTRAEGPDRYIGQIMQGISRSVLGELTMPILIISAVTIGIGLLALVISALARSPEEQFEAMTGIPAASASSITPTPTNMAAITPADPFVQQSGPSPTPPPDTPHTE